MTIEGENLHIDKVNANLDYPSCLALDKTFLDFHALQNCDMVVISDSGFGRLGVWNREQPDKDLYVFQDFQNETKHFTKLSGMNDLYIL